MRTTRRQEGKFYTPRETASRLIELINGRPTTILDLCSGPGALAEAAVARFQPHRVVTIDNDPAVRPVLGSAIGLRHLHLVADALRIEGSDLDGNGDFDLVLTNPPFGNRPRCEELLSVVDRSIPGRGPRAVTLEMTALAQALSFVRRGGSVAAILPDTLVAGSRASWFRMQIQNIADILHAEALPSGTFARTDARTYLVVLQKRYAAQQTPSVAAVTPLPTSLFEPFGTAGTSMQKPVHTLAELGVRVTRGAVSATKARAERHDVFHTDGFKAAGGDGSLELRGHNPYPGVVQAAPGDILIARVDRRLEDKIAIVSRGTLPISDCVYRLRCPEHLTSRVWGWLRSPAGRAALTAGVRGVSARHLPKHELLDTAIH